MSNILELIRKLESDDAESTLESALAHLEAGGDVRLLMAVLFALVAGGVAGLAARLLETLRPQLPNTEELSALAGQIAGLPSGEIPVEVLRNRITAAADLVLTSRPYLHSLRSALVEPPPDIIAFRSNSENVYAIRDGNPRRFDSVFRLYDQQAQARDLRFPPIETITGVLAVGVPAPALWRRLVSLRAADGYIVPIDVIEPDPEVFALWLGLIEDAEAFADERVLLALGEDVLEQYEAVFRTWPWRQAPGVTITSRRPGVRLPTIDATFFAPINEDIEGSRARARVRQDERFAGRDEAWWADRFDGEISGETRLRVVGFTSRFSTVIQYAMAGLKSAFEARGCTFDLMMEPNPYCRGVDVWSGLDQEHTDLIVVINHLRSECSGHIHARIPYVCWIQDHLERLWTKDAGRSVSPFDLVLGHSPGVMSRLCDYPRDRFLPSCNLTDARLYTADPVPDSDLRPYRCDVSYVSHGAETPEELVREIVAQAGAPFGAYAGRFLELAGDLLDRQSYVTLNDILPLLLQAERDSGHPALTPEIRRVHVYPQLARLYDRLFRHQTLEWIARWTESRGRIFRIYGRGWHRHPTLRHFACGEIEYGYPLRCLYQASAVSLQINGYASMHQRLLDGLASGGFMLSRFNPSDFIRRPLRRIQRVIEDSGLRSLDELLEYAASNEDLRAAMTEATSLGMQHIAPANDPRRREEIEWLRLGNNLPEDDLTDEGLFDLLRSLDLVVHRAAGDLQGFEMTTFRSEPDLQMLLDRYVDDRESRRAISEPMRTSALAHDTYDVIVDRILHAFRDRFGSARLQAVG